MCVYVCACARVYVCDSKIYNINTKNIPFKSHLISTMYHGLH